MSEVQFLPFEEVIHVYQPETLSLKSLDLEGDYPVYGANGIIGKHSTYNHENSELVLGCRGSVGKVHVTQPKSWINGNAMVVRPKSDHLRIGYIKYGLLGGFSIDEAISGTAQPQITRTSLSALKVPVPSVESQDQIVQKLETVDLLVKHLLDLIITSREQYFQLRASFLNEQFEFIDSLFFKKLSSVARVISGQSPEGNTYNKDGLGVEFHQGKKSFTEKFLATSGVWTSNPIKMSESGDIVFSVRAPVGPVNLVTRQISIGRGLAAIRPGKNLDAEFLFYFLKSIEPKLVGSDGAVFPSINRTEIENINVPVIELAEQRTIVSRIEQFNHHVATELLNNEKKFQEVNNFFESILSQIYSGGNS